MLAQRAGPPLLVAGRQHVAMPRRSGGTSNSTCRPTRLARKELERRDGVVPRATGSIAPVTDAEEEANKKRWQESGKQQGSVDEWRWTLNWDEIDENIVVGSCPRSPSDVDRILAEANCDAIICLQCDMCHEALQIDWQPLRKRAVGQGMLITRVAVRDFDRNDQALMLPEAVRMLHMLLSLGRRVYVHCTAGINRATLTVVGYLTFIKGMPLDQAEALVKRKRPQAHPYIDCWRIVRARLVEGRREEVAGIARAIAEERGGNGGQSGDKNDDWHRAEERLIQMTFERQCDVTLSLLSAQTEVHAAQFTTAANLLSAQAAVMRSKTQKPTELDVEPPQVLEGCMVALDIAKEASGKVDELRVAMEEVAKSARAALNDSPAP